MFVIEERSLVAVLGAFAATLTVGFGLNTLLPEPREPVKTAIDVQAPEHPLVIASRNGDSNHVLQVESTARKGI
jgi:hypothetical protein